MEMWPMDSAESAKGEERRMEDGGREAKKEREREREMIVMTQK